MFNINYRETPPKTDLDRVATFRIGGDTPSRGQSGHQTGTGSPHTSHTAQYMRARKKIEKTPYTV
jgi:hypothetical protein